MEMVINLVTQPESTKGWVKSHAHQLKSKTLILQIINKNEKLVINKLTTIKAKYGYLIFKNLCYLATP